MQDKKKSNEEGVILLGKSCDIEGDLRFYGTARVDGRFRGKISGEGTLEIGEVGRIEADVHVSRIIVFGEIRGNLTAEERIEIKVPGKVFGDMEAPLITVESGAVFHGKCLTRQPDSVDKDELEMKSSVRAAQ